MSRHAGLLVPLFSVRSSRSWGVGEIPDLVAIAGWLHAAHLDLIQLLPLNEMAPGLHSPYSALSAMAIDPVFIHVPAVQEFADLSGAALTVEEAAEIADLRAAPRIEYARVRRLKMSALTRAFERFVDREWTTGSARSGELRDYAARESWWLESYSLFRAIHAEAGERDWLEWPPELQRRDVSALGRARQRLWKDVLFRQYLQWIAQRQWEQARASARLPVLGDLPFTVDRDSADVWSEQEFFRLDASVGVPPDAFSATGQNWGLPAYRWERLASADYLWLRERARRAATLFDGCRIDHVVGFYRTYTIPDAEEEPSFQPAREEEQLALGERVLRLLGDSGRHMFAEDLGTVPRFVRDSLARLGVPGYRVLRWEREWDEEGQPFRDPSRYSPRSVATSGTHDTETLASWWDECPADDREAIAQLPTVRAILSARGETEAALVARFDQTVRDVLLETLFASGSDYLILPVQDLFGWADRINVPATVEESNWTWCLPVPVDRLAEAPEWQERQVTLKRWAEKHQRG